MKPFNSMLTAIKKLSLSEWVYIIFIMYILKIIFSYLASYSIDIGGVEFSFVHHIQLIHKNIKMYGDPDVYPFYILFHPPLYLYFISKLMYMLKVDTFLHVHELLVSMRSISFFFMLLSGFILLRILKIVTANSSNKILVYLLFLLLITQHIFAARPDSLKLFFFMLFLLTAVKYTLEGEKKSTLIAASIYSVICIFIKHDALIYILMFWFLYFRYYRKKNAIIAVLLLILLVFWGLIRCNEKFGPDFLRNIFYYNLKYSNDISVNVMFMLNNFIRLSPFLFFTWFNFKSSNKSYKFLASLSLLYFIMSNFTMVRTGANLNYTYESVMLMILNFAIYRKEHLLNWKVKYEIALVIFLILFCPYLKLDPEVLNKKIIEKEKTDYINNLKDGNELKDIIGKDTVFFTNPKYVIFNAKLNLIYGYDIYFDRYSELYFNVTIKPILYSNDVSKKYDRYFEEGKVNYVITDDTKKATDQIDKYYHNYSYFKRVGNLIVYKYNKIP